MLRPLPYFFMPMRFLNQSKNPPRFWKHEEQKYEQVNYYPSHFDHTDPPIEPTKLLVVQRVKPYKGNPYWHKRILDTLKLNKIASDIAIVKNTPEIAAQLWKIKHLIKVTAMKIPEKLPEDNDSRATWLHENGQLLVIPRADPAREQATLDFISNPKRLDPQTMMYELRMRWLNPWDT